MGSEDRSLVGRCGLYCGYCSIYRAYKDSESLREEFAKIYGCGPEEVRCDGCQTLDGYSWCQEEKWGENCKMLRCLDSRHITYCCECPEYETCKRFEEFAQDNLRMGIDVRENLRMIGEGKVGEWLREQDEKWRCPSCGKPIIVSEVIDHCHMCGIKLRA